MITITLKRASNGFIQKFTISGHAGYAPEGSDIICSAISALGHTAVGALQDLAHLRVDYRTRDTEGYMECTAPAPEEMASKQYLIADTIMETFALGCRQIEASYCDKKRKNKYIHIDDSRFIE